MKAFSRTGGSPLEGAFVRGSMCLIGRKQSIWAVSYTHLDVYKRQARHIEELSFTDPLTGGWTLARFRTGAAGVLEHAGSGEHAIVYLDIVRFKSFNAAFGYAEGDRLLKALTSF